MSSILKALKKLEDDTTTRWPGEYKIDTEIVRSDNPPRLSPAVLLVTSLLLLAGGSGVTFMYMKKDTAPEFSQPKSLSTPRQNPPHVSASDIKTERLPEALEVVPAKQQNAEKADTPKQRQPPALTATTPATVSKPVKSFVVSKPAGVPLTAPQKSTPHQLSASTKSVPALRVNGIAFQGGGADSVAMINGEPFSSGAVINGAKIEEIHKNKVRFSYNGEVFEILLGQSNQ
jgi:general secretion pathway protein B